MFFGGYFNEMLLPWEKDGLRPQHQNRIELFRGFLYIAGLIDMELKDSKFSWIKNPGGGMVTRVVVRLILFNNNE